MNPCNVCQFWAGHFADRGADGHHPACPRKVDAKRTNVPAVAVPAAEDMQWYRDPGECEPPLGDHFQFACPGCGRNGAIRCTAPKTKTSWEIVSGTLVDPSSLTLSPSINCIGCCGWHGYLRGGVFVSC